MKQLLREPLLHFLLLGAGLFVAFGLVGKRTSGEPGQIVITQGQIEPVFSYSQQKPPPSTASGITVVIPVGA